MGAKKNIFFIEPDNLEININDVPQEIRIWSIPEQPMRYRDELIIMIKNNPIPVILPMICNGAKPIVDIMPGSLPV